MSGGALNFSEVTRADAGFSSDELCIDLTL